MEFWILICETYSWVYSKIYFLKKYSWNWMYVLQRGSEEAGILLQIVLSTHRAIHTSILVQFKYNIARSLSFLRKDCGLTCLSAIKFT